MPPERPATPEDTMAAETTPPPLFRSEAFAEDLEPESAPPPATGLVLGALLAMLPAMVALGSSAAAVLTRSS